MPKLSYTDNVKLTHTVIAAVKSSTIEIHLEKYAGNNYYVVLSEPCGHERRLAVTRTGGNFWAWCQHNACLFPKDIAEKVVLQLLMSR